MRFIRILGVLTIVGFIVASMTGASNVLARRIGVAPVPVHEADAIVVLGSGVMRGGVLDEESMRRVIAGIELFKKGLAPMLILSGTGRSDSPNSLTEAAVRAKLAEDMGIPPACILKEETANTTREEAAHIGKTLHERGASNILLVTEGLHMRRAKRVFERAGLNVQPAISTDWVSVAASPKDRLWLTMRVMQESAALVYYRVAGYID